MAATHDIQQELHNFTKDAILKFCEPYVMLGRTDRRSRVHLLETITTLPVEVQNKIVSAAKSVSPTKRKYHPGSVNQSVKKPRNELELNIKLEETRVGATFLEAPSEATVQECIARYIDRTNNQALKSATCVVCARRVFETTTTLYQLAEIPN